MFAALKEKICQCFGGKCGKEERAQKTPENLHREDHQLRDEEAKHLGQDVEESMDASDPAAKY